MGLADKSQRAGVIIGWLFKAKGEETRPLLDELSNIYPDITFSFTEKGGLHVRMPAGKRLPRVIHYFANEILEVDPHGVSHVLKSREPLVGRPWYARLRERVL